MARRCLPRAIPSISSTSRVQVRTYRRPRRAETNERDNRILRTLRTIKTDIRELKEYNKETRALVEETREEIRALGEGEIRALSEKVTILSPLKVIAVSTQERPFATLPSGERVGEIEDPSASWTRIGSDIEPAADVITDVCMFKNGLLHYNETFTTLYGLDWQAAEEFIGYPHMVSAMNKRANVLAATKSTEWAKEGEFDQLRRWTQNATPEELVEFTKDLAGVTYPKQLFLNIMRDS